MASTAEVVVRKWLVQLFTNLRYIHILCVNTRYHLRGCRSNLAPYHSPAKNVFCGSANTADSSLIRAPARAPVAAGDSERQ
jgi:hypothetical protein